MNATPAYDPYCKYLPLTVSCSSQHPVSIPGLLPEIQEPAPLSYSASVQETLTQLQGLPIEQFLEESYRRIVIRDPDTVIFMEGTYAKLKEGPFGGYGITNDRFTNISDAYIRETQELHHGILDLLRSYDRSAMAYDLQVAYDIYEWYLVDLISAHQFMYHNYPVSSAQSWNMSQIQRRIPYDRYENRISARCTGLHHPPVRALTPG
jgi:hypothetical protein